MLLRVTVAVRLVDRPQLGAENGDQRNIATLLADQVECANVIVINKAGMGWDGSAKQPCGKNSGADVMDVHIICSWFGI